MGYRGPGGGSTSLKISLDADGTIVIHTGFYEQGTGTYTTLRQIALKNYRATGKDSHRRVDTDSSAPFDTGLAAAAARASPAARRVKRPATQKKNF